MLVVLRLRNTGLDKPNTSKEINGKTIQIEIKAIEASNHIMCLEGRTLPDEGTMGKVSLRRQKKLLN